MKFTWKAKIPLSPPPTVLEQAKLLEGATKQAVFDCQAVVEAIHAEWRSFARDYNAVVDIHGRLAFAAVRDVAEREQIDAKLGDVKRRLQEAEAAASRAQSEFAGAKQAREDAEITECLKENPHGDNR